jgi:hypothetical protein
VDIQGVLICAVTSIAGHRHRSRCRRPHSGTLHLSPVPEQFGAGLDLSIPVPDWFQHRYFFSFQYRNDRMLDSPAFRHTKSCMKEVAHLGCSVAHTVQCSFNRVQRSSEGCSPAAPFRFHRKCEEPRRPPSEMKKTGFHAPLLLREAP